MSRILFPLRTSVEFFNDPTSLAAVHRAKEASLLYDEVIFEAGLYDIGITEGGSFANWRPPGGFTAEDLAHSRRIPEPGSGMRVSMGIQPDFDQPAPPEAVTLAFEGKLIANYRAEWHSGVLDDLRALEADWCAMTVWGESDPKLADLKEPLAAAQDALSRAYPEKDDESPLVRDFIIKTLAHDAVIASSMGAAMNMTSLYAPLVESLGHRPDPSGGTALGFFVPDAADLSWEQIAEFRGHSGAVEARGKLREFEERALASEPDDPMEFRERLFGEITRGLLAAISELMPDSRRDLAEEAIKTGVSFIPFAGPFLGPGASFIEALKDAHTQRHAWYAALMRLQTAAAA